MNAEATGVGNAEHYTWGDACDGWHLVKSQELSIIEERMPPGTSEVLHFHHQADQFFYVLEGEAQMEIEAGAISLKARQGIFVPRGTKHKIRNASCHDVQFLVVSRPTTRGDREDLESRGGTQASRK